MNPIPLTKEQAAENIKGMFKIFKFLIIFINVIVVAIAIVEKQLPDIGSKILFCIVLCGASWLAYFCAKGMKDNMDESDVQKKQS